MVVMIEALALQLTARKLLKFSSKIPRSGLDVFRLRDSEANR